MKKTTYFIVIILLLGVSLTAYSQSVNTVALPKYVVIGAEDTKLLGGIGIYIAKKKSESKNEMVNLEYYLHTTQKVRTVTDLLNEMDQLGFEYVNTFVGGTKSIGTNGSYTYGDAEKTRYNLVFKKRQ